MARKKLQATLSKNSFNQLAKQVEMFGSQYIKGIQIGVEEATKQLYETIIKKLNDNNLSNHIGNVYYSYDNLARIGKVWTDDIVIIFHEFGTGVKGTQDNWASLFDYQVNQSGKGEKGWYFYNENGDYGGITHGLSTKHIFYESLMEIKKQLPKTMSVSVSRTIGEMY